MENKIFTVSKLSNYIKNVFDDELVLHSLTVQGEVCDVSLSNNSTFFSIKDADCTLNCVLFSRDESIAIGSEIICFGSVKFYAKTGKISFVVSSIKQKGAGNIFANFNDLKEKLAKEGVLTNKLAFPNIIMDIGLITSQNGAVIHDFLTVLSSYGCKANICLYPARVQGDGSDSEIISGLNYFEQTQNVDVVVIARGGGSTLDLSTFNSEKLVRAIAKLTIPTISAVGHEVDFTLCDLSATIRAGTPSIAGEIIGQTYIKFYNNFRTNIATLRQNILKLQSSKQKRLLANSDRLVVDINYLLKNLQSKMSLLSSKMENTLEKKVQQGKTQTKRYQDKMRYLSEKHVYSNEDRLNSLLIKLNSLNPMSLLLKGYARVSQNGKTLNSLEQLSLDGNINISFADGELIAKPERIVNKIVKDDKENDNSYEK